MTIFLPRSNPSHPLLHAQMFITVNIFSEMNLVCFLIFGTSFPAVLQFKKKRLFLEEVKRTYSDGYNGYFTLFDLGESRPLPMCLVKGNSFHAYCPHSHMCLNPHQD